MHPALACGEGYARRFAQPFVDLRQQRLQAFAVADELVPGHRLVPHLPAQRLDQRFSLAAAFGE